jgi:hypothetical protein
MIFRCLSLVLVFVLVCAYASAQWLQTNGPYGGSIRCLAVSGTNLFAGTYGGGLWRRSLSQLVDVKLASREVPAEFTLAQNFPNPFNPSTTIKYELPKASDVRLSVFDILGREVSVLVNERRDAGVHEEKFDGSNLASGLYLYRLQARDFVQTRKLLLVR